MVLTASVRNLTTDTVPETIYSGDFTCTLDPNSMDDDAVAENYTLGDPSGDTCVLNKTDCGIAYYCWNGQISDVFMKFLFSMPAGDIAVTSDTTVNCHETVCPSYNVGCDGL